MKSLTFLFVILPAFLFSQIQPLFYTNKVVHHNSIISEDDFFLQKQQSLGLNKDVTMVLKSRNVDKNNIVHSKYQQYYKGIKVVGGTYILHSKHDMVYKSTGSLYPDIKLNTMPTLKESRVAGIAKIIVLGKIADRNIENINFEKLKSLYVPEIELCIIDNDYPDFSKNYKLAYSVLVENNNMTNPLKKRIYIDADTGEEILSYDMICTSHAHGKGESIYYGEVEFDTDSIAPDRFVMQDLDRGSGIFIKDKWNNSIEFYDDDNYWEFEDEGQQSAIDALYCTQAYYDFLMNKFQRNSIDGNGFPLTANVNIKSYVNAYWDGNSATFGAGDCTNYSPLTTMAIVGHEFTHGMTDFTSNLVYKDEPGALNESLSDIFGESLEYHSDSTNFRWTVGTRITRNNSVKPFRSMKDPHLFKNPNYYHGKYWSTDFFDNGGVHSNSSILNYWFYLLSQGGSGINEGKDTFDVEAIGIDKALDIVYQMQTNYLTENSNFGDAYEYSVESVSDLYGNTSPEMNSVIEAWKAVGIPKELNYNENKKEKIDFNILYNNKSGLFSFFCADELPEMEIRFINNNKKAIPADTKIELTVKSENLIDTGGFFAKEVIYDTFYFEKILENDLLVDSSFSFVLNIDTTGYNLKNNYFALLINMNLIKDTITENFLDIGSINFRDVYEDYYTSLYFKAYKDCEDEYINLEKINLLFVNHGCREFQKEDSVSLIFSSPDDEIKYSFGRGDIFFGDFLIFPDLQENMDLSSIEDIDNYSLQILLNTDGHHISVFEDSLKFLIKQPLHNDEVLDFGDDLYKSKLNIDFDGVLCDTSIVNSRLKIESKWYTNLNNDCLSFEDFFKVNKKDRGFSQIVDVSFCTDIDTIAKPYLVFDISGSKIGSCGRVKKYSKVLQVNQGDSPLDYLLIDNKDMKHIEIPVNNDMSNKIVLSFYVEGAYTLIDNISIIDKQSTNTKELDLNKFVINNPVINYLTIKSGDEKVKWEFELYNIQGERIFVKRNCQGEMRVNINYPAGMYFYKILNSSKILQTGKIIIVD